MTIKSRRLRSGGGAGSSFSINTSGTIGASLVALFLSMGATGCPGSLDESLLVDGGNRPPPAVTPPASPPIPATPAPSGLGTGGAGGGAAGRGGGMGGRGGMGGSSPKRPDAGNAAPAPAGPNCWDPPEIAKLLNAKCVMCHNNSGQPAGGLDLQSPSAKTRLLNVDSKGCFDGGSTLVPRKLVTVQGNYVGGHFFDKLRGMQPMQCGLRMPRSPVMGMPGTPLQDTEIWCLQYWFSPPMQGAKPPAPPTPAAPPPNPAPPPNNAPPPTPPVAASCANPAVDGPNILKNKCGISCHNPAVPGFPGPMLDLLNVGLQTRLESIPAKGCAGKTLIVKGRPEGHLFDKLQGPVAGCGDKMPPLGAPLSAADVKCLKDWIAPGVAQ